MTKSRILSTLAKYGVAAISVAVAMALNAVIPELEGAAGVLFLAAVTVSAYYGGLGPGVLATVVSVPLLDYFFVSEVPAVDFGPAVAASLAVFVAVAVAINSLHVLQRRLQTALRLQNQRQTQFMAVLAHELRNFLSPISSAVAVLKIRGKGDEAVEQTCGIVERQFRNMTRLVNDLLDVARINEGKVQLAVERVDLAAVLTRAADAARPLIESRQHHFETTLPGSPLYLRGDTTRLEQVFVNLLSNAAKYTEPGGRISLSVERIGAELLVRVRDTGKGLSAEVLPHVFDLFMQVEDGSQGGLGIGLNLVQGLVEMHGGTVTAFSGGPGQGSEFVVRLPATEEIEPAQQGKRPLVVARAH